MSNTIFKSLRSKVSHWTSKVSIGMNVLKKQERALDVAHVGDSKKEEKKKDQYSSDFNGYPIFQSVDDCKQPTSNIPTKIVGVIDTEIEDQDILSKAQKNLQQFLDTTPQERMRYLKHHFKARVVTEKDIKNQEGIKGLLNQGGVFAKRDIPPSTIIPYTGQYIDSKQQLDKKIGE